MCAREKRTVAAGVLYHSAEKLDGYGLHRRSCVQFRETVVAGDVAPTIMPAMNVEICCVKLAVCVASAPSVRLFAAQGCGLLKSSAS